MIADPERYVEQCEIARALDAALDTFPPRWAEIMRRRLDGATLKQVGAVYGVTQERIRQIEQKVMRKIRQCCQPSYRQLRDLARGLDR